MPRQYTRVPIADRFWPKVNKDGPIPEYAPHLGPCWIWTAGTAGTGFLYGCIFLPPGQRLYAHRVAYELAVGRIPDGCEVDHLCRVTLCVNPSHLEPVTRLENVLRSGSIGGVYARRTECANGHPYTDENTYRGGAPSGRSRRCRQCDREKKARMRQEARSGTV